MASVPKLIDMRSDTVTRPCQGMLRAMAAAEVGDDVLGDDPTVHRLQDRIAELLGKEAGLFVPSGTMGNQLALRAQTSPGDQIVVEDGAHIYRYEAGAPAALSGRAVGAAPRLGAGAASAGSAAAAAAPDRASAASSRRRIEMLSSASTLARPSARRASASSTFSGFAGISLMRTPVAL